MGYCLTDSRMNLICDIIKPVGAPISTITPTGTWQYRQNPDSFAIERVWTVDDLLTDIDETEGGHVITDVPLLARGIIDGGIRVAGTTERFNTAYENIDWVKASFPKSASITKRDQVTNIRTARTGELVWKEEELDGAPATVFNVMGVQPILDPFGQYLEQSVLLQRAEVQNV